MVLAVNGLKFLVNAGSPEPSMTRHWWPAFAVAVAVGVAEAPVVTPTAATATAPTSPAVIRPERRDRIGPLIPPPAFLSLQPSWRGGSTHSYKPAPAAPEGAPCSLASASSGRPASAFVPILPEGFAVTVTR